MPFDDASGRSGGPPLNVLGLPLEPCGDDPVTGFYRDCYCNSGPDDLGVHTVCVEMTSAFLEFSGSRGNDFSTPIPEFGFPGLQPGDRWCLCAARWQEAFEARHAPQVYLARTHLHTLQIVELDDLKADAIDLV